jgi:Domain of unknown function (DUF4189)
MVRITLLLLISVLLYSAEVNAEGRCPPGYHPVGTNTTGYLGCAPIPGAGEDSAPVDPGPRWVTRWGAIAIDGSTGKFAGTEGMSNERKAKRSAITQCRNNGGKQCKVIATYYNQCGALAWGDAKATGYSGPEREETVQLAIQACSKQTTNCQAYYSGCSYPEQIQ